MKNQKCKWFENSSYKKTIRATGDWYGCQLNSKRQHKKGSLKVGRSIKADYTYEAFKLGGSKCKDFINYTKNFRDTNKFKGSSTNQYDENGFKSSGYCPTIKGQKVKATYEMYIDNITYNNFDTLKAYYNKWNNFFTQNSSFPKETKAVIDIDNNNEGAINTTIEKTFYGKGYLGHFIYAAIDTTFEKGEMNKNIFVFEQFGNKIIPVGYLANDPNTPLKFNVITRNPQTFKIEKINDKPLNFCEAMKYTGDKFSQYCSCKDENGNIVTQFNKIQPCDNHFGCIIKAVKPSNSGSMFKLF